MRTNVLNDLSNVVKKGTILAVSWAGVGRILEEGAIEHPLITHSAPIQHPLGSGGNQQETRWKPLLPPRFFARIASMVTLLLTLACGQMWGAEYSGTVTFYRTGGTLTASTITNDNANVTFTFSDLAAGGSAKICNVSSRYGIKGKNQTLITVTCPSGYYFKSAQFKLGSFGGSETPTAAIYTGSTRLYQCSAHTYTKLDASTCGDVFSCEDSITNFVSSKYTTLSVKETGGSKNLTVLYLDYTIAPTDGGDPTPSTYTVTYDGNGKTGGSVPTDSNSPYEENDEVTVLGNTGTLVKTNYTFTGWNTAADGSGTHYDADDTFTMGTSNVTLYAEWQYSFTTHSPGTYTAAVGSGGYGKTLKTVSSRDYEVYLFSASSSKGTLYAGSASSITDGKALFSGVAANAEGVASDGWLIAKASTYAGSGSTNVNEFSGSSGALTTHYAGITSAQSIKMKISGYDQFSMIGRDGSTTSGKGKFIVKVDGVSQSITATTTDNNVYRFDISTGTHIIEITADGTDNVSRFRGFSLRLPAAACTAPNHVDISGRWDRFAGETINLTATAYDGSDAEIAAANITGYQWQKLEGSTWTNVSNGTVSGATTTGATAKNLLITNCGAGNSGKYRCVVSTGATCSTASATATDGSQGFGVKVFMLECYNDGTKTCSFTRTGDTQTGTATLTLAANTAYTFKFHVDNVYYGNNASINEDITNYVFCNSDNGGNCASNFTINSGLGGTFTLGIDYSTGGNSNVEGEPELSVTYPRKTIYLVPNSDWLSNSAKFAFHYYGTSGTGWTDFLTSNDCGMSAEIPQWNGLNVIAVRLKNTCTSPNWDDKWNQTADIAATADKNCVTITDWNAGTYGTYSTPTYTISYNAGTGGSGSKASESKTCGVDFTLPGSTFTYAGHTQDGWATADGGAIDYALSGSYTTNDDEEFFSHWKCNTPTITDNGDNTVTITVPAGTTVRYTTDGTNPTSSTGTVYSSAFTIDATVTVKAIAYQSGCTDSEVASQACTYHAPVAVQTALVANTLYEVPDMIPSGASLTTGDQFFEGLSANTKFELIGSASNSKTPKVNNDPNNDRTIDGITFDDGSMWFKGVADLSSNIPTTFGLSFIVPEGGGKLYLYFSTANTNIKLAKAGSAGSTPALTDGYAAEDVTAGTYYLYGTNTSGNYRFYGLKLVTCTTPAEPTAFTAGSITSTGATFTITDAAGAASYDIYYSTSNTAPDASTPATTTSTSKTKAVTGLTASTTYYAWVRSVCDASHKSAWVALSGSSFETEADDGCDMKYWFRQKTDAPAAVQTAGKEQDSFFSDTPSGSSGGSSWSANWTIDEIAYSVTKRAGNGTKICTFTVPTGKTATLYILGQGGSGVTLSLKKSGSSTELSGAAFAANPTKITIENLSSGTYTAKTSGNVGLAMVIVKLCEALTPCTTPVIPTLSNQMVCPGSDIAAWDATQTASLETGETATYSWKKKGSETVLGTSATLDLGSSATESQSGTYVVTVTVSADGKASKSASKEVTLTVTAAVEEPSISSNKATVYAGNSVTLTATCGTAGVTWNWYLCANADGTGAGSSLATTAAYTFPAPEVGTHYYKATASTSGTCASSASAVYTLTVSEASGTCNMMTIFDGSTMSSAPASTSGSEATSGAAWTAVGTAIEMSSTVSMEYSGKTYTKGWKFVGSASGSSNRYIQIVIPEGYTGDLVMNGFIGSTGRSVFVHTSPTGSLQTGIAYWTPATTNTLYTATTRLSAGTYYICATNAAYLTELSVNVCGTESCTDEKPTATATNNTVCSGTALTITATGYADGATTFQWQKKNGDSWNNISSATSATYTVASAAVADAGTYRVQVTKGCTRNSNEVTIAVPSEPVFGAVPSSVTVMQTIALSISTVEATDAVSYKWYKSANSSLEAGDPEIGSSKELMKAYADEAIGTPSYYVFCVATNSCGADTTSAIAVNVTAYVEQDCAVVGSSGEHNTFGKTGSVSSGTYGGVTELHTNSNNKYIYYTAEDGYYFSKAIVNACVGNASDLPTASYSYSTDGGENWTDVNLTGMTTDYQNHIINLPASVNAFRVGRRLGDTGTSSSTIYIHEVCFEYTERCTATTITVSPSSVDYEIGDPWSNPTFTLSVAGTLTYSSSDEDIATVDENTGEVSFNDRAGTVHITASYAGGEISSTEYCASQGSYTITVSCEDEAPKIVPGGTVNMSGCNNSVDLEAKQSNGTAFASGTYQWYRNDVAISGATSASYTAVQAGTYTVERTGTGGCTNLSSNSAVITSEYVEPEVKHLVPCQYYHVDSTYSAFMKMRHLFTVSGSAEYNSSGRNFKMELSKNGAVATDVTTSNAFSVIKSDDNTIDTVMIDLNKLNDKYAENDELVLTCKAVDCSGNVSEVYKDSITIHVIDQTPTMALILAGKDGGALNEYEPKNLQKQTGEKTWSGEWPLYTELKKEYIITPLNGYAPFNKLNYEQYDIIFLTDFPKKSKNATAINNLADLVDYRPMFTFKTHMSGLSKWATKGFTEDPEVPKQSRLRLNIVCYAHPMFEELQTPSIKNQMLRDASDNTQLVYTLLTEGGYEKKDDVRKGIQGFDFSASDNFVTIGLIHMDATAADSVPTNEEVTWTPGSSDKTLVAAAERQNNPEARMVMFSLNAGAHSKLTETGQNVVLACLEYLLQDVMIKPMADCAYTFDNDEGRGNGKWSEANNWLQEELPGPYQAVKVIAPATVDYPNAKALEVRLIDDGKITIAKNGVLTVQSTIRRKDGSTAIPTEDGDLVIETAADGQGALIFNNDRGDSRATVNLYSLGRKDGDNYQFQYIAMPMGCVPVHPYFEGSDILTYAYTEAGGWERRGYYTDLYAFEGIGITTRRSTASSFVIQGALTSTESQSLDMTYENSIAADKGYNMFGNSWSAPIQISQLGVGNEGADIQKTVYIYVAGKDPDGGPTSSGDKTEVAGKWLAIPFDASGFAGWTGLKVIPAFQAFEIQANSATTFKLDYNKMVRGGTTDMNAYLRAPKHRTDEAHEGIELTVLHLTGGKVNNDLFMFEGQNFSEEFDNGWEATFKEDEEIPTQLYSPTPVGKLAVAALPSLEGAKVNFTTNETGEYTFTFSGAGNAYYLNDIKEQKSALIKEGNAYVFALEEGDAPDRFYISHTPLGAPAIATGVDEVDSEALKVRKIIHNDQLYIIRGGQLYDATGKVVK